MWQGFRKSLATTILTVASFGIGATETCCAWQDSLQDCIPSSAFALVDVKPKSALAQPSMKLLPTELIKVFGEKELGINLLELKQVTLVIDQIVDPNMADPPDFGVLVQFDSPQTLSGKVLEKMQASTFEGHPSYVLQPEKASLIVIDEKTMMLGSDSFLKKMLNARALPVPC